MLFLNMCQHTTDVALVNYAVDTPAEPVNELTYNVTCKNKNTKCGATVKKESKCSHRGTKD